LALCHREVVDPVEHFTQQVFIKYLAAEPVEAGGGKALIRLDPKPQHLNHNGTVNAAVIYGLSEVTGAGAVVAEMLELAAEAYTVVKNATIDFLAPATGVLPATGRTDMGVLQAAKEQLANGQAVEVEAAVAVTEEQGKEVATVPACLHRLRSICVTPESVNGPRGPIHKVCAEARGWAARTRK